MEMFKVFYKLTPGSERTELKKTDTTVKYTGRVVNITVLLSLPIVSAILFEY